MTNQDLARLTSAPPPIQRDETLTKLLERLQKEDRLFNYNVPPNIRASYDNEALFEHLKRTYSQQVFVVEDPAEIKKYLLIGDRVVKKGDAEVKKARLVKRTKGQVRTYEQNGKVKVNFDNYGELEIAIDQLAVYYKYREFLPDKEYSPPLPATKIKGGLDWQYYVIYTGEDIVDTVAKIPEGTLGIVVNPFNVKEGHNVHIIWANGPDVVQKYLCWQNNWSTAPEAVWTYESFKLVVPNQVNLQKLLNEIRGPQ